MPDDPNLEEELNDEEIIEEDEVDEETEPDDSTSDDDQTIIPEDDPNPIINTENQYYGTNDQSVVPDETYTWSTTTPELNTYVWVRVKTTRQDGTIEYSTPVLDVSQSEPRGTGDDVIPDSGLPDQTYTDDLPDAGTYEEDEEPYFVDDIPPRDEVTVEEEINTFVYNQETIFNLLTNSGEAEGLFWQTVDGHKQLFVNMSFARSGILQLGGTNNAFGVAQILDSSGNVVGQWDQTGITLSKGVIRSADNSMRIDLTNNTITLPTGSITSGSLAVGDFTNYATVNQYIDLMNSTEGRETVVFTDTNNNDILVYRKKTESQNYLPVAVGLVGNPFQTGDQVYYDITLRTTSGNAGNVTLMVACYNSSKTFITGHGATLALTASYQRFTGSISISNASFDTASYVFFYINDTRDTKKQILVKSARIYRKTVGNLIVDGTISASQINGGTLTVGGSNNANGQIVVLDANGDNVGTWDNNGLTGAKKLETAMGDLTTITLNRGKNVGTATYQDVTKMTMTPGRIRSILTGVSSPIAQMIPMEFTGTTYDNVPFGGNQIPYTYGWYMIPMIYSHKLFTDDGEVASRNALDELYTVTCRSNLVIDEFETITNWNTTFDEDTEGINHYFRLLKSYNASNAPTSGAHHYVGLELSFSDIHRIQIAMRTNTATVAAPLYVRHMNSSTGTWLGWASIATTAV